MSDDSDHGKAGLPPEGCVTPSPAAQDSSEQAGSDATPPTLKRSYQHHTIRSIGLDLAMYRAGRLVHLLPPYTHSAKALPLPSSPEELAEVAALTYSPEDRTQQFACYIRRCRLRLKRRKADLAATIHLKAALEATEATKSIQEAAVDARKATEEAKAEIKRQLAPISEAMKLVGEVLTRQMQAHLENREINGEKVSLDQARMAALGTASITAKLGGKVAEEATKEAEEAVFEEMVRSTRERVGNAPNPRSDEPN